MAIFKTIKNRGRCSLLLVLRHGQTALNAKGYFNGQYDEPFSAEGRAQAADKARTTLASIHIDRVFCSPLTRTRETCEIALAGRALPITFEPRLMERTMGPLDGRELGYGGFSPDDLFNYNYHLDLPGFENWPDFFARVHEFLAELFAKYCDTDETILLVTHGGVSRAIYYYFFPVGADGDTSEPGLHNCEVCEFAIHSVGEGKYDADYLGLK